MGVGFFRKPISCTAIDRRVDTVVLPVFLGGGIFGLGRWDMRGSGWGGWVEELLVDEGLAEIGC